MNWPSYRLLQISLQSFVFFAGQKNISKLSLFSCLQAVFAPESNAFKTSDLLMRDATNATNMFQIARKDMNLWHSTYLQTIQKVHDLMLPEHICPNVSVPLSNLKELKMQIEKVSLQKDHSISYHRYLLDLASYRFENVAKRSLSSWMF